MTTAGVLILAMAVCSLVAISRYDLKPEGSINEASLVPNWIQAVINAFDLIGIYIKHYFIQVWTTLLIWIWRFFRCSLDTWIFPVFFPLERALFFCRLFYLRIVTPNVFINRRDNRLSNVRSTCLSPFFFPILTCSGIAWMKLLYGTTFNASDSEVE